MPVDASNTCYRVAESFLQGARIERHVSIVIAKSLPVQGGLGHVTTAPPRIAISKTRPNSLFASLAVTDDGSSVSPRLFRNVATWSRPARRRRATDEPDPVFVFAVCAFICSAPSYVPILANMY